MRPAAARRLLTNVRGATAGSSMGGGLFTSGGTASETAKVFNNVAQSFPNSNF